MIEVPPSQSAYEFVFDVLRDGQLFRQHIEVQNISLTYSESSSAAERTRFFLEVYGGYLAKSEKVVREWLDNWVRENDPRRGDKYVVAYRGSNRIF